MYRDIHIDPRWFRRMNHTGGAAFILYYLFPKKIIFGIPREILLILLIIFPISTELNRLIRKRDFIGLHAREEGKIASYMWFAVCSGALMLFLPQKIAAPCIVSAALIDPVLGELKRFGRITAILLAIGASFLIFSAFEYSIMLALVAAIVGVIAEYPNLKFLDDDVLMQIVPAIIIGIIIIMEVSFFEPFPENLIEPINWWLF